MISTQRFFPIFYTANKQRSTLALRHINIGFRLLFLLVTLLTPRVTPANEPLPAIELDQNHYDLSGYFEYLEDDSKKLDIDQISHLPNSEWRRVKTAALSLGMRDTAVWVHFLVTAPKNAPETDSWQAVINNAVLNDIQFYAKSEQDSWVKIPSTEAYIFNLPFVPEITNHYYFRVDAQSPPLIPLSVLQKNERGRWSKNRTIYTSMYYGSMLIMLIFFSAIALSYSNKTYGLHAAYIISILFFNMTMDGTFKQYIWPGNYMIGIACNFFSNLTILSGSEFSRQVLRTKFLAPALDNTLRAISFISILFIALSPIAGYAIMAPATFLMSGFATIIIFTSSLKVYSMGHREVRFFLFGWFSFLFFTMTTTLSFAGLIPWTSAFPYYIHIGSVIEISFISISLVDQFNHYRLEKIKAETQAKEQLAFINAQLVKSNQLKDQFLSTISHELRTPMNGVLGALDLVKLEALPTQASEYLRTANHSAQDMIRLVDDLLCFSDLSGGDKSPKENTFNVTSIRDYLLDKFRAKASAKRIELNINIDEFPARWVCSDQEKLRTLLFQLVDNAIKFTELGAVNVLLRTQETKNSNINLCLIIEDTGIGITPEKLHSLYHAFHQADGTFSRKYGGLGIGLAICKKITECLRGEISVSSELGKGTRVEVLIPAKHASPPANDLIADHATAGNVQIHIPKVALIVEDNPVNQKVLSGFLKKLSIESSLANNGLEAVELCEQKRFDVIFMDCQMPVMNGFDATLKIRAQGGKNCDVPIIAVTANALEDDKEHCLAVGMNGFLKKPVTLSEIRLALADGKIMVRFDEDSHMAIKSAT